MGDNRSTKMTLTGLLLQAALFFQPFLFDDEPWFVLKLTIDDEWRAERY